MTKFEKLVKKFTNPWVILSYLLIVSLSFMYIDKPIAFFFHSLMINPVWLEPLTLLGWNMLYIIPLFLAALFFRYLKKNKSWESKMWFLWGCVFIPNVICNILKITLGRARPILLFKEHLYGFYGFHLNKVYWSFPSGHTTTIMGLSVGLSILFPKYMKYFILIGCLVMLSRIVLTHHYFSDVLAAAYLTLIEIGVLYYLVITKKFIKI